MNNNIKVCFPNENTFDIISEILGNYGIDEGVEESLFKEKSLIDVVYKLAKEMALENISKEAFILTLQQELKISKEIAENMVDDVQKKILPLAEKNKIEEEKEKEADNKEKPIPSPGRFINKNQTVTKKPIIKKIEENPLKEKINQSKNIGKPPEEKKESDKYRESIE